MKIKNSTSIVKIVCAILFLIFTFYYLYAYQAEVLAVGQHVLSNGVTHYDRTIGACFITVMLFLLQWGISIVTRLDGKFHALSYFPSMLLLTMLTDLSPDAEDNITLGSWIWLLPVLLVIYIVLVYMYNQYKVCNPRSNDKMFSFRTMWVNMLTMLLLFVMAGALSNHSDIFHYRAKAESCILEGNYTGALNCGARSLETDSSLTMIRAYALAKTNNLGEKLFEFPLVGGSNSLLPNANVRFMMYPDYRVYRNFGIRLKQQLSPMAYLQFLERHNKMNRMAADYLLTAYLLDKKLDAFVRTIGKYYDLEANLPKHYKEALILYTHLHSTPYLVYHNDVMDVDFKDYQQLYHSENNSVVRKTKLRDVYGNTYWYYYEYGE